MIGPVLRRMWGKLNLSARLMTGSGIALTLSSAALLYTVVLNDVERNRRDLHEKIKYELEFIAPAIAEQAVIGDYSFISQMLNTRVEQRDIAKAGWVDSMGNPLVAVSPPGALRAPGWFVRWIDLPTDEVSRELDIGGQSYGRVFLQVDPTPTTNIIWDNSVDMMQLLLFGIGLLFSVTLAIASNGLRPIMELAQSAVRFGRGDYSVRMESDGSPEIVASIEAFNSMAENIQSLVNSLNENRSVLFAEKERAQVTLASIADAVVTTDTRGNVDYLNPVAEKLTGWTLAEAVGKSLPLVCRLSTENGGELIDDALGALLDGAPAGKMQHAVLLSKHGDQHPIEHSSASIRNREGETIGTVLVFRDVGESRKMAHQLSWQATHDALTGLVNRAEFERRLDLLVDESNADGIAHAMLYLDLDQFKVVNDTCGHVAGDGMLREVSALLHTRIRESDTLARLGGDEFGVLLHGCKMERALTVAESLRQAVAEFRFAVHDKAFVIGISIGVVAITGDGQAASGVLAAADAACYSAKDKGRNRIQPYYPGDAELLQRHGEMQWVSRLTSAFEEDRLTLHCQRILGIQPDIGSEPHYEVLLRMLDETGELTPPMAFIPAAERYNLMPVIDRKVITMAFAACRTLIDAGGAMPLLCLNISGASLNDESFLAFVHEQFKRYAVPPHMICFEITETVAIANLTRATRLIRDMRQLGSKFSLDDFGSGLSSFAYLKALPVDFLKIDGGFIKDMTTDPIDRAMVKAIIEIGHVMGIKTIGEWVENDSTLAMLRDMGVDYAQGFVIDVPRPLDQVMQQRAAAPVAGPKGLRTAI
jgi:diguanylate cyclase (GGDEF)-like protein/PAS domain S-box-containing protein